MTFREKVTKEHPEAIEPNQFGGVIGCPHLYGYESEDRIYCEPNNYLANQVICAKCWDREIPETEKIHSETTNKKGKTSNMNEKLKAFILGLGALTEMWRITYGEFVKSGMKDKEALTHTQGFMTAFMTATFGVNDKPEQG